MNETLIHIAGNAVSDPELRYTKAGDAVTSFRMASTSRHFDRSLGGYVDGVTNFITVTAFRGIALNVVSSVRKGQPLLVYGRLRINHWTNGERSGTSVEVDAVNLGHDLRLGSSAFQRVTRPAVKAVSRSDAVATTEPDDASEDATAAPRPAELSESDLTAAAGEEAPAAAGDYFGDPDSDDYVVSEPLAS